MLTPTWLKAISRLHLVVITLWGDDRIDTEIITRDLRAVMTVVAEWDDEVGGVWRRRLWVGR